MLSIFRRGNFVFASRGQSVPELLKFRGLRQNLEIIEKIYYITYW